MGICPGEFSLALAKMLFENGGKAMYQAEANVMGHINFMDTPGHLIGLPIVETLTGLGGQAWQISSTGQARVALGWRDLTLQKV